MKKKYELIHYAAYNVTGMKLHLEKMARKGWLLDYMTNHYWRYKKVKPQELTFEVSYFTKALTYEPEKSSGQETFEELCAHDGWILVAENGKLQIYSNQDKNATPIYTEPESEVNAIVKSSKAFIVGSLLLMVIALLNTFHFIKLLRENPIWILADTSFIFIEIAILIMLVQIIIILTKYYVWKHKAIKAFETEEFIPTAKSDFSLETWLTTIALVIMFVGVFATGDYIQTQFIIIMFCLLLGFYFMIDAFRRFLKRKKVSVDENLFYTILFDIIVVIGLAIFLTYFVFYSDRDHRSSDGVLFTMADFIEGESNQMNVRYKESMFLSSNEAFSYGNDEEYLSYYVVDVKMERLEDYVLDKMLNNRNDDPIHVADFCYVYREIDAREFNAEQVWQLYENDKALNTYLIKYGNRLAEVEFSWILSSQDKDKLSSIIR